MDKNTADPRFTTIELVNLLIDRLLLTYRENVVLASQVEQLQEYCKELVEQTKSADEQ